MYFYLPRNQLAAYAKYRTFSWCEKIDGPWLHWIAWIVDLKVQHDIILHMSVIIIVLLFKFLLGHVKTVMYGYIITEWSNN